MSLLISTYVPEGIIIAGDSRLTLNWTAKEPGGAEKVVSVTASDSNTKVFEIKGKFGLGTFGAAEIKGIPISGYIHQFIEEKINAETEIDQIAQYLHEFFGEALGKPLTYFYLAGYRVEKRVSVPYVYLVNINQGTTRRINQINDQVKFGTNWGGESEVMTRLFSEIKIQQGKELVSLKPTGIPFKFFTLQDAVDFSNYAVKTTIETFRFQQRIKTVGGPVDIMAITPAGIKWIKKKELHGN